MKVVFALIALLLCAARARAQAITDSTDRQAARILDEAGAPAGDPNEIFDYLDVLFFDPPAPKSHASPEVSWIDTRGARLPAVPLWGSPKLALRSRAGLAVSAFDEAGYADGSYLGSPYNVRDRFSITAGPATLAISQSKGAWEPHLAEHMTGFLRWKSPIELLPFVRVVSGLIGDYSLAFGNGLLFGSGVTASRSNSAAVAAEERSFGLRGSLSNAPRTLRGGSLEIGLGPLNLTAFASSRMLDARRVGDTIVTIATSPTHTTPSEAALIDGAAERAVGSRLEWCLSDSLGVMGHLGATGALVSFDHPYAGPSAGPFIGRESLESSVDVLAIGRRWSFSAEGAWSHALISSGAALSASLLLQPSPTTAFAIQYHHIPLEFFSPFGSIPGASNGLPLGRDGVYFGLQSVRILERVRISAYAEVSTQPDARFGIQDEAADYFAAAYVTVVPNMLNVSATVRTKRSTGLAAAAPTGLTFATQNVAETNERYEAEWKIEPHIQTIVRYEHQFAALTSESGDAVRLLLQFESDRGSRASAAFTRFSTQSFATAMYDYEAGLPGSGNIVLLSGKGERVMFRGTTAVGDALDLSLYLGASLYDDYRTIGSGASLRTGRSEVSVAAQLDLRM